MKTILSCFKLASTKSTLPVCDFNQVAFILKGGSQLSHIDCTQEEIRRIVDGLLFNYVYCLNPDNLAGNKIIDILLNSVRPDERIRCIYPNYSICEQYYSDRYFANQFAHIPSKYKPIFMTDLLYWLRDVYVIELNHSVKNILRQFYYHAAVTPAKGNPADEFKNDKLGFQITFRTIINLLYRNRDYSEDYITAQLSTCVVVFLIILNLRCNTLYESKYVSDNKVNNHYRHLLVQIIWS